MTHMYFSARTEGRISYGHLSRTDSCLLLSSIKNIVDMNGNKQFVQ